MNDPVYEKTIAYLKEDPFKHLATLKHLSLYQDALTLSLVEQPPDWAVIVKIPTAILSYDSATYPEAKITLFLNGTSEPLKQRLLEPLPPNNYVLKLNEDLDKSTLENSGARPRFRIEAGNSFHSYSSSTVPDSTMNGLIPGSPHITDEAIDLIKRNGYLEAEIRKYFDRGAVWFGLIINGKIRSGCFTYENYGTIWEIAGVHTVETDRNKGYARTVVISALTYLLRRKLVPRYEVDVRNTNSIRLAQSLGMKEFLRINHFLLHPL